MLDELFDQADLQLDALDHRIAQSEAKVDRAVHKVVGGLNEMQPQGGAAGLNPTIQHEIRLIEHMRSEAQRRAELEEAEAVFRQKYDPEANGPPPAAPLPHPPYPFTAARAPAIPVAHAGLGSPHFPPPAATFPPSGLDVPGVMLLQQQQQQHHQQQQQKQQQEAEHHQAETVLRQALVDAETALQSERNRALQTMEAGRHLQLLTHEDARVHVDELRRYVDILHKELYDTKATVRQLEGKVAEERAARHKVSRVLIKEHAKLKEERRVRDQMEKLLVAVRDAANSGQQQREMDALRANVEQLQRINSAPQVVFRQK